MGVVTVTIEEDVKQRFRKKLYELDCDKGAMGEAISQALDKWIIDNESAKKEWEKIAEERLALGGEEFDREKVNERQVRD